ncbi:MAG TPA: hypothetical protein VJV97_11745 [Gemmatimonadaceae bacterium]|nr:hypothetical protein [Gemmatimonadaceae bacterium]
MIRRKLWRLGAALFVLINLGGAAFAIAMGQPMHAAVHAVLLVLGVTAYGAWRLTPSAQRRDLKEPDPRLEYLQQSVDAMALEVERIGEAQRFSDKLRAERDKISPPKKEQ